MPRHSRVPLRFAFVGLAALALAMPPLAQSRAANPSSNRNATDRTAVDRSGSGRATDDVLLNADQVTRDNVNETVMASGHVEFVLGGAMLLANKVIWNQSTDIVTASGDVKLVDEKGDIYFGDYLEITDDMRDGFIRNVSGLLADNSRLAGRQADKQGPITVIDRAVYSPCVLCAEDPTRPPTWQLKAEKIIHDTDEKRIYYHNATFEVDGVPVLWTPYFSTYDPSVKRADGILEAMPGYRSELGFFGRSTYYIDIAPDKDATLEAGYFSLQGPLLGGEYRERFDAGQFKISGSVAESSIRQYPTAINQREKTIRGHVFGNGEFDLSDNWRAGFEFARSLDAIYVRKYGYSSLDVLPSDLYVEGFFGRDYVNATFYSFQDLRPGIVGVQPHALPYLHFSLFGDPGETLGGRWADNGGLLILQRFPGENVERISNNFSWERKLIADIGLVTDIEASVETDYYWTQHPAPNPPPSTGRPKTSAGRFFPQASAVFHYPLTTDIDYAQFVIEPVISTVLAPTRASNRNVPNEDSQNIELDQANLFSLNRFPGVDRVDDGSRVAYGARAGLYNLGTGYTTLFLGQSYRINGHTRFPPSSGLQNGGSDYIGQIEINPGQMLDIDYRFELSNDLKNDRLQEINFRVGPDRFGIFGTYLFAADVNVPNYATSERNELSLAAYYRFDENWSVTAGNTTEISHPRAVLRYSLSAGYTDDCSSFTFNIAHDKTLPVGGTSGTAFFIQIKLKTLGVFRTPSVH